MKQGLRFFVRPGTFINQLQWSTHHWMILFVFLTLAGIESHVGKSQYYYQALSQIVARKYSISWDQAVWVVTTIKLSLMLLGSFLLASFIWMVGNVFGRRTSRRVLFRRLSVVFTVFLAGYTLQHLNLSHPITPFLTTAFYLWGAVLGYFAIREQFALRHVEAFVLGLFAVLLVSSTWHYSNHIMHNYAKSELAMLHKRR